MTGLARKLMGLPADFGATYANQWFERTLDDSAIRRMDIPQAFLLTDAILKLFLNITSGMVVYPKQIERHLRQELPFMATEKILMECVEKGKSRQEMHEVVKVHSVAAGKVVKQDGGDNDLLSRLGNDDDIPFSPEELVGMVGTGEEFTGRASEQTEEYLTEVVEPRLAQYKDLLGDMNSELSV
jgi:adenylosuccinate lyase